MIRLHLLQTLYEPCSKMPHCRTGLKIGYNNGLFTKKLYKARAKWGIISFSYSFYLQYNQIYCQYTTTDKKLKLITLKRVSFVDQTGQHLCFKQATPTKIVQDKHNLQARYLNRLPAILLKANDMKCIVESITYPYD